jgi:hypothetical protein
MHVEKAEWKIKKLLLCESSSCQKQKTRDWLIIRQHNEPELSLNSLTLSRRHSQKSFVIDVCLVNLLVKLVRKNHIPRTSDNSINIEVDCEPIASHKPSSFCFLR